MHRGETTTPSRLASDFCAPASTPSTTGTGCLPARRSTPVRPRPSALRTHSETKKSEHCRSQPVRVQHNVRTDVCISESYHSGALTGAPNPLTRALRDANTRTLRSRHQAVRRRSPLLGDAHLVTPSCYSRVRPARPRQVVSARTDSARCHRPFERVRGRHRPASRQGRRCCPRMTRWRSRAAEPARTQGVCAWTIVIPRAKSTIQSSPESAVLRITNAIPSAVVS